MSIVDLNTKRLENWAGEYATIYDMEGEGPAGVFLVANVPEEQHSELAPYIRTALERLDWKFPDQEEKQPTS